MTSAEKQKLKKIYTHHLFMVMLKQVAASQSIVMKKQTNKQQQQQQQNVNKISTWLNVYLKYATIQES